jgi:hypothetical protein
MNKHFILIALVLSVFIKFKCRVERLLFLDSGKKLLVIWKNLPAEGLVPEARNADETNFRPGTGQLAIPAVRGAAGASGLSCFKQHPQKLPKFWNILKSAYKKKSL